MANLRIKDITTTASSTASGEYLAIDGLANGTRKLSATAPTFAGAVTATGGFVGALTGNADTVTTNANLTGGVTSVGNAATVVTNANLTGTVTSTGNATAIANAAISNAMLANSAVANLSGTNTGDNTVSTSGAATTAETLLTARTIGGSSFNGSANVTSFPIPGAIGGTTPSAGAFTTLTSNAGATFDNFAGTAWTVNPSAASANEWRIDSTNPDQLKHTGYLKLFSTEDITMNPGAVSMAIFSTTGLAVTGTGSFTGALAANGGITITTANGVANAIYSLQSGNSEWGIGQKGSDNTLYITNQTGSQALGYGPQTISIASNGAVAMGNGLAVTGTGSFTGGINSTAIGATTPSTGAFTTLGVTGNCSFGDVFSISGAVQGRFFASGGAATVFLESFTNHPVSIRVNQSGVALFSSTGLAVTGTGTLTKTAASAGSVAALLQNANTNAGIGARLAWRLDNLANEWGYINVNRVGAGATSQMDFGINGAAYSGAASVGMSLSTTGLAVTGTGSFTGGINSTAIGATTPSTGAFTTLNSSGILTAMTMKMGTGFGSLGEVSHHSLFNSSSYALLQDSAGATYLNAATGQVLRFRINNSTIGEVSSTGLAVVGAGSFTGALSKGSGSFKIPHPLESKKDTHQLVHSFIEGPQADLIYRGKVSLVNGTASVNIDESATMTEGTFEVLCRDVQCFTSNESNFGAVRGSVSGNILTVTAEDAQSEAVISWMVIGERQDPHIMETDWTDEDGHVIVEPVNAEVQSAPDL